MAKHMPNASESHLSTGAGLAPIDSPTRQHHRLATSEKSVNGESNPNGMEKPSGKSSIAGQPKNY